MLITLYGINNIGKSTQAQRLVARLKAEGFDAVYVKYPVYDLEPSGPQLNRILRSEKGQSVSDHELQMWFALNRFQFEPHLKEWLLDEQIVVAEDYTGTGLAWGAVKGLDLEWLEQINAPLIKEDIALLMDGERFKEASENGHRHESDEDAMQRARQIHLALAAKYDWKIVSAKGTLEEVEARLWDQIRLHLPQK